MNERWRGLRNSFFAGLLVVVPVAASVLILVGLFNWVTNFMLPPALHDKMLTPLYRVAALVVFVILTALIGWVTRLVLGKRVMAALEALIGQVPVLNKTYGFMKEVSHTLLSDKKTMFQRVVLVDLSGTGVYSLAFVTSEKEWEAQAKTGTALMNVFLLASPPTHGYALSVPRDRVVELEMSVAEGMKMLISGGAVVPPPKATGNEANA